LPRKPGLRRGGWGEVARGSRQWGRDSWGYFPPSRPRPAKGGIKARSRRGAFGATWWGKRWIEVLGQFGWGARLDRGRRYARMGQVLDFTLTPGIVTARVQGSRPKPYTVRIALRPLAPAAWTRVTKALSGQAVFSAALLSGEMPEGVEDLFRKAKAPLFPRSGDDFEMDCSCPDWANPCKHVAAVHYILGEALDRDPFLLFALRGREKGRLLESLRAARAPRAPSRAKRAGHKAAGPAAAPLQRLALEPLPSDPAAFFGASADLGAFDSGIREPAVPDAILRRLGDPAFLRGAPHVVEALEKAYQTVGERALEEAVGWRPRRAPPGRRKGPVGRPGRREAR